jgi:hypothetical protein
VKKVPSSAPPRLRVNLTSSLYTNPPPSAGYNHLVRIPAVLLLIVSLAACNSASKNNDAVRQGVVDYLAQKGLNINGMDIAITNLELKGSQADATVNMTPKGVSAAQGMSMKYHLEEKSGKWTVVGRQDAGASPHGGGAAMPEAGAVPANPHGGAPPAGKMPSPEDLPPAKKQ